MREINDLSGVLREGCWIAGSIVVAAAMPYVGEDVHNAVPFFSVSFYLLTWLLRLAVRAFRRRRSS